MSCSHAGTDHSSSMSQDRYDADWGRKEYRGIRKDGTAWEKIIME